MWQYFFFFLLAVQSLDITARVEATQDNPVQPRVTIQSRSQTPIKSSRFQKILHANIIGIRTRSLLNSGYFNKALGWFADTRASSYLINLFVKWNKIDITESPYTTDYASFNDFFARTLSQEALAARIAEPDNESIIICPADGQLFVEERLSDQSQFCIKGTQFNLIKLLGGPANRKRAEQFANGTALIFYLAPHNYHRFHFPIHCQPTEPPVRVRGDYETVSPFVYSYLNPLEENERFLFQLSDDVVMVIVGAMGVGRVEFNENVTNTGTTVPHIFKHGDDMGCFKFGASTVVLLFKRDTCTLDDTIRQKMLSLQIKDDRTRQDEVKMGERIGVYRRSTHTPSPIKPLVARTGKKKRRRGKRKQVGTLSKNAPKKRT
jgi:phosphatidylserine decarboxylase